MIQPIQTTAVSISDEVRDFAAEAGVGAELPAVVEMTQRIFPEGKWTVELDDDPEIPNDRHILIVAEDINVPVAEGLDKTWEWHRGLFVCCPAPLACVFRVSARGFR
jgi:hypothetical protein